MTGLDILIETGVAGLFIIPAAALIVGMVAMLLVGLQYK